MIKKIFAFISCLLPVGAGAVVVGPEFGTVVSTEQTDWNIAAGVIINDENVTGIESPVALTVNNMMVGANDASGVLENNLFVMDTVMADPFTVLMGGDLSVMNMLTVLNEKHLGIKAYDSASNGFNFVAAGITVGTNVSSAELDVETLGNFTVSGDINSYGDISVHAGEIQLDDINVHSGTFNATATNVFRAETLLSDGDADVVLMSDNAIVINGFVQNIGSGQMELGAGGDIEIGGVLENKSVNDLIVKTDGALIIDGTMTNEMSEATVNLNVGAWRVNGGDIDTGSVINDGDLYAIVQNDAYFENGIKISDMAHASVFSLDTGTLSFGANADALFSNSLDNLNITVRNGGLNLGAVLNGADANLDANMNLVAQQIFANTVNNTGNVLLMKANAETGGNLSVSGQVINAANSNTSLVATGVLTVENEVVNAGGTILLNAPIVNLAGISNVGTDEKKSIMSVLSLMDETGKIQVNGNVLNENGDLTVEARDVSVTGSVINSSGTLKLIASDADGGAVQLNGNVNIAGGNADFNALAGAISINGSLSISGGNLNLGAGLYSLYAGESDVQISGSLTSANQATGVGNLFVMAQGTQDFVLTANTIEIGKGLVVGDGVVSRNMVLDSDSIYVKENVIVKELGALTLGGDVSDVVKITGMLQVDQGAELDAVAGNFTLGSLLMNGKFIARAESLTATDGDIEIQANLYFDGDTTNTGFQIDVDKTNEFVMKTTKDNSLLYIDAVSVGAGKKLELNSAGDISIGGTMTSSGDVLLTATGDIGIDGTIINAGGLNVSANSISLGAIENSSSEVVEIVANSGSVVVQNSISNTGDAFSINATDLISATAITNTAGGVMALSSDQINTQSIVVDVDSELSLNASTISVNGNVKSAGDFVQGADAVVSGTLNHNTVDFVAGNLLVDGGFYANAGNTTYKIGTNFIIENDLSVAGGAIVKVEAENLSVKNVINSGVLSLSAKRGMDFSSIVNNSGVTNLDSGDGLLDVGALTLNAGNLTLAGQGVVLDGSIDTGAMLYQGWGSALQNKDINIISDNYVMTAASLNMSGINQDGKLVVNTSDVHIGANGVDATDLRFIAQKNDDGDTLWQNIKVDGNVSGNVDFIGLEKMQVMGSYVFNNGSSINAAILKYADGVALNTTDVNYWADVALTDDKNLGKITNPTGDSAGALISVAGKFETDLTLIGGVENDALTDAQIGIDLFESVDMGTAIWFLHADQGIDDLAAKIRNLNVRFCNADGTLCYNYFDTLKNVGSDDSEDLPIYITERDTDGDFQVDSLYIVFDPRFGGPVDVYKIQDVVARQDEYTVDEFISAGAIDDMVAGQLANKKFGHRTPIELIPVSFKGTNLSKVATELYNRMEYYDATRDGTVYVPFSRLFQARELELIAGNLALNEHTTFRSFEDRMLDEFIWNRGRRLKKSWLDVDYGMFFQNAKDAKHANGNRFSISGGFDWQETDTLMLGLTGRITRSSSDVSDSMDLSYANIKEQGYVDITVTDTNVGFGAYLMKIVNEKARIYGNAFLDLHVFDVDRNQNFIASIDGEGTAISLISEWGLMHDILNQYLVGNLYARIGYNSGFSVTNKVAGTDYMKLKSDSYFVFTPGYSLIAQKRIYPSAWFQIRPYASVGIEYDVLGMQDKAMYKFAVADKYTNYDYEIDPLWANFGGGVEFVAANGVQVGLDYRYQYNSVLQLHNIKVSGSYRF